MTPDALIAPLCILGGALLGAAWELAQREFRGRGRSAHVLPVDVEVAS